MTRLLAHRAQERELERLRHERQPEVEVEDVRAREEPRERRELLRQAARLSPAGRSSDSSASGCSL